MTEDANRMSRATPGNYIEQAADAIGSGAVCKLPTSFDRPLINNRPTGRHFLHSHQQVGQARVVYLWA